MIARGHRFRTHSDTETIVHLYEEYGRECVKQLRGMFAFAIWDSRTRELFVARDRLGIKPLYYRLTPERFSSAQKSRSFSLTPRFVPNSIVRRCPSIWRSATFRAPRPSTQGFAN